jgi:5-methylcytosine-specific restriction endonuclease McrA
MKSKPKQDRAWLLATAKNVAENLKQRSEGTSLRIRMPYRVKHTNTDGWSVTIGDLGKNQPRMEVWLDRFSGYPERKLYACFYTELKQQITFIVRQVNKKLWRVRVITNADTEDGKYMVLVDRLSRSEFNMPIMEQYEDGENFYGFYDPTRETAERVSPHFCARAAAFFEDVARSLPHATAKDEQREIYPQNENRKQVASHLHRERSSLLATECKIRDNYACQVCGFRFEDAYGKLGNEFAEAHHLVPLARLKENVRTKIEDLATVCANCHRMLHRMAGKRDDIIKLRAKLNNHR